MEVYCVKCSIVVGAIWFTSGQKNYEGCHVSKFVNGFRNQIEIHTELMNECCSQTQRQVWEVLKVREEMQQQKGIFESDVLNRKDSM